MNLFTVKKKQIIINLYFQHIVLTNCFDNSEIKDLIQVMMKISSKKWFLYLKYEF